MAPFYRGYDDNNLRLDEDDITAIQRLYGEEEEEEEEEEDKEDDDMQTWGEDICSDSSIDTIVTTKDNTTYVFKGTAETSTTKSNLLSLISFLSSPRKQSQREFLCHCFWWNPYITMEWLEETLTSWVQPKMWTDVSTWDGADCPVPDRVICRFGLVFCRWLFEGRGSLPRPL